MSYNFYKTNGFDAYRTWFNRMFSLSLDGKFVGLLRLGKSLDLFVHKLAKLLSRPATMRPLDEVITFRVSGHTVKLYNC